MTTIYDVPPQQLIDLTAVKLREFEQIAPPSWTIDVKTGTHAETQPVQEDWWHVRIAAVLRKVYVYGPIGTERLAAEFGGSKDRKVKPNKSVKGSRSVVRKALQQLEAAGLDGPRWYERLRNPGAAVEVVPGSAASLASDYAHLAEEILRTLQERESVDLRDDASVGPPA